jgi:hypothetical protein
MNGDILDATILKERARLSDRVAHDLRDAGFSSIAK